MSKLDRGGSHYEWRGMRWTYLPSRVARLSYDWRVMEWVGCCRVGLARGGEMRGKRGFERLARSTDSVSSLDHSRAQQSTAAATTGLLSPASAHDTHSLNANSQLDAVLPSPPPPPSLPRPQLIPHLPTHYSYPTPHSTSMNPPVRKVSLPPLHEFRFELDQNESLAITLLQGSAEVFGFELVPGQPYPFGDEARAAVWSAEGAELEMSLVSSSCSEVQWVTGGSR